MKKTMNWMLIHILHWAVLYGAFVLELDGAVYILKFYIWLMLPLASLLLMDEAAKTAAKSTSTPVPYRTMMVRLQSWTTLGLLVWYGMGTLPRPRLGQW